MKVIRLNEGQKEYNALLQTANELGLGDTYLEDNGITPEKVTKDNFADLEDRLYKKQSDVKNINFSQLKSDLGKSPKKFVDELKSFYNNGNIPSYGGNNTKNLLSVINNYRPAFIQYFVKCLGVENIGDTNNLILTALSNNSAPRLLFGNEDVFVDFYNVVNDAKEIGIDNQYLKNTDSLLYYPKLYSKTNDIDDIKELVAYSLQDGTNLEEIKNSIDNNSYGSYTKNKDDRENQITNKASQVFNNLDKNKKLKFLVDKGVKQSTAQEVVNQIEANHK